LAGTTSSNQGAREVYGAIAARLETAAGDSAMDEANDAVRVNVVAGSAGGDGGTQYAEDTASAAGDELTMAGVVRRDSAGTLVDTDGDRTQMQVDANGLLRVNASGVAVPITDNGSTLSIDDGAGSLTVDGTVAATQSGAWTVTIQDGGNVISVDDGAGSLTVDGTVAISSLAGSTTASGPATVTIGTTSATVIASNANRKGLALTNTSTGSQRVSLHMANGSAVLDSGRTLWPGDIFEMDPWSFTTAQINGIASAAGATIGIQEMT
jgi:hypothetical protein